MGNLIKIFREKNKIFMVRKHENAPEWEKTKNNRLEKFLRFCEAEQTKDIHQIRKKHYDQFIQYLSTAGKSDETIRKYSLALKEFFLRAHLNIQVNPNHAKNRRVFKKLKKIEIILQTKEISDQKIENIIAEIEKIL